METLTIVVTDNSMRVVDGGVKGARRKYYAPGLEIYIVGRIRAARRDAVNHLAFEQFLARHISLRSVVSEGWV